MENSSMRKSIIVHVMYWCFMLVCFVSCGNKNSILQLENLVDELECNSDNYSAEDWAIFIDEYEQIISEIDESQLSEKELQELARLNGKCYAYIIKGSAKIAGEELERGASLFNSALDGFLEVFE